MFDRLAKVDREFIKAKVQAGFYTSEIELVRDAIRKMREEDEKQAQLAALRKLIMTGHQQAFALGPAGAFQQDVTVCHGESA